MVSRKVAKKLIEKYSKAWTEQNPDAILKIFTKNAKYQERVMDRPFIGHSEIKRYWQKKVVEEQKNIHFKLLSLFVDGDNLIAEWEAKFYNKRKRAKIRMKEVAIMKIKNNKIASLREYWSSK